MKERVKFLHDAWINHPSINAEKLYSAGQVVLLDAPSARRWVRRGVAEILPPEPPEPETTPEAPKQRRRKRRVNRSRNRTSSGTDLNNGSENASKSGLV